MKKLFIALTSVMMLGACAGSAEKTYDIAYIDFTEEEQELFANEIGASDEAYLSEGAEIYKISANSLITVSKLADSTSVTDLCKCDLAIASVWLKLMKDSLPGVTDEMFDSYDSASCTNVDEYNCAGMYYDLGPDYSITYMIFGDESSYTSLPLKRDVVAAWTAERRAEAEYANSSETSLRVLLNLLQVARGEYPSVYCGITKTLSTGQKVRINFTAERK